MNHIEKIIDKREGTPMRIFWKIREEGDLEETIEIKELFNPY